MFATGRPGLPTGYLRSTEESKTILIETDQFDVFGDSSVVIKFGRDTHRAPELLLRLKHTGPVLAVGGPVSLFHKRGRSTGPVCEFDKEQNPPHPDGIDEFLRTTRRHFGFSMTLSPTAICGRRQHFMTDVAALFSRRSLTSNRQGNRATTRGNSVYRPTAVSGALLTLRCTPGVTFMRGEPVVQALLVASW